MDTLDREVAGLTCRQVLAGLGDYLDGELPPPAVAQVEAHLAGCQNCARYGGSVGRAVGALRGAGVSPVPPDVLARLEVRLRALREGVAG